MSEISQLVVLLAAALLLILAIIVLWQRDRRKLHSRIELMLSTQETDIVDARRDSVEKSRSALKGRIAEQFAPALPGFPYFPPDARFIGTPIDYVVFGGLSGTPPDGTLAEPLEIILLEVKQAGSGLSPVQRRIGRAVRDGRVRFEIARISEEGNVTIEKWQPRPSGPTSPGSA